VFLEFIHFQLGQQEKRGKRWRDLWQKGDTDGSAGGAGGTDEQQRETEQRERQEQHEDSH
jgi:hypothetical protein